MEGTEPCVLSRPQAHALARLQAQAAQRSKAALPQLQARARALGYTPLDLTGEQTRSLSLPAPLCGTLRESGAGIQHLRLHRAAGARQGAHAHPHPLPL